MNGVGAHLCRYSNDFVGFLKNLISRLITYLDALKEARDRDSTVAAPPIDHDHDRAAPSGPPALEHDGGERPPDVESIKTPKGTASTKLCELVWRLGLQLESLVSVSSECGLHEYPPHIGVFWRDSGRVADFKGLRSQAAGDTEETADSREENAAHTRPGNAHAAGELPL
jgi:hypothetical protein